MSLMLEKSDKVLSKSGCVEGKIRPTKNDRVIETDELLKVAEKLDGNIFVIKDFEDIFPYKISIENDTITIPSKILNRIKSTGYRLKYETGTRIGDGNRIVKFELVDMEGNNNENNR